MDPRPHLSLILPARDEAALIASSLTTVHRHLCQLGLSFELIVGDDGSVDQTADIASHLALAGVSVVRGPRLGKGAILTACARQSTGAYVGFIDSDLEIGIEYVSELLAKLDQGFWVAAASKAAARHGSERPLQRRLATATYNAVVRSLFGTTLTDHQAGFKLFRGEPLREILPSISSTGWLWDTEVLVKLIRAGGTVAEVPVRTRPRADGRLRVASVSAKALADLVRLYFAIRTERH